MQPGLRAVLFGSSFYPEASVALDFVARRFRIGQVSPTGVFSSLPGVSVSRASVGYAETSGGVLQLFQSNTARFTDKGLLVEEARTNLFTFSQEFDNAAWVKTRATVSANAAVAPDGTLTADKIVEDTTAGNSHFIKYNGAAISSGTAHGTAFYLKAAGRSWVRIQWNGTSTQSAFFNLSGAGAVGTVGSSATASIQALAGGWYRCMLFNSPASTSSGWEVYTATGDGVSSYDGDGSSGVYIWQADLNASVTFMTSPIPTTSAQATRAADVASVGGLTSASAFTLVASATGGAASTVPRLMEFSDGTSNNRAALYSTSGATGSLVVTSGGVSQADISGGAVTAGSTYAVAGRVAANDFGVSRNGGAVVADTSGSVPSLTTLYLGNSSANQPLNGYIRRALIYPRAFTDAELQAASAA